jgi:hypothetical protein
MANLTANRQMPVRIPTGGLETRKVHLAGYTNFGSGSTAFTVFKGAVVMSDVSDTDGYARDMDSGITVTTSDIFLGIAAERVDVTSSDTADGSKDITVYTNGTWGFPLNSLAITDLGAVAYADDDNLATTTATGNLAIGTIVDVDASYLWVDISGFAGRLSATTS